MSIILRDGDVRNEGAPLYVAPSTAIAINSLLTMNANGLLVPTTAVTDKIFAVSMGAKRTTDADFASVTQIGGQKLVDRDFEITVNGTTAPTQLNVGKYYNITANTSNIDLTTVATFTTGQFYVVALAQAAPQPSAGANPIYTVVVRLNNGFQTI